MSFYIFEPRKFTVLFIVAIIIIYLATGPMSKCIAKLHNQFGSCYLMTQLKQRSRDKIDYKIIIVLYEVCVVF